MNILNFHYFSLTIIVMIIGCFIFPVNITAAVDSEKSDNEIFSNLLEKYVKNGVVNYAGLKKDERKLNQYLNILEQKDVSSLSRKGKMAFYINVYNAWTIKLILSGYPGVKSIKDLGGFWGPWKKKIVRLNGQVVTLDHIEHDILRPKFKDPRVHFAVNCASKGCPLLLSEPYYGEKLDEQLNRVTRKFINNTERNYLAGDKLYVSSIFKWFSEDFNDDVIGFFIKYADAGLKKEIKSKQSRLKVKYLKYDWSLNGY